MYKFQIAHLHNKIEKYEEKRKYKRKEHKVIIIFVLKQLYFYTEKGF